MNEKTLRSWLKKQIKESKKFYREAEKIRDECGGIADIEAIEQSAYNQGVIDTCNQLLQMLDDSQ